MAKKRKATTRVSSEEARWRAEADARSLMEAHAIRKDKNRFMKAREKARELIKERKAEVAGLQQLIETAPK